MRTVDVRSYRQTIAVIVASLSLGACVGAPPATVAPQDEIQQQASLTRLVLKEAGVSARAYGQAHLGHFLDLNPKRLRKEGLELPPDLSVRVRTSHSSFCISATNESLPSIHPWAVGTISSKGLNPSSEDTCDH